MSMTRMTAIWSEVPTFLYQACWAGHSLEEFVHHPVLDLRDADDVVFAVAGGRLVVGLLSGSLRGGQGQDQGERGEHTRSNTHEFSPAADHKNPLPSCFVTCNDPCPVRRMCIAVNDRSYYLALLNAFRGGYVAFGKGGIELDGVLSDERPARHHHG